MKLIFEDGYDHYLEDPDNEKRIKKAEKDTEKLAGKLLPKKEEPLYLDINGYYYPNGPQDFNSRYFCSGIGVPVSLLEPDYDLLDRAAEIEVRIVDPGQNTKEGQILKVFKWATEKV